MNPVTYEILKSAIGRTSAAGGGVTTVGTDAGPVVLGLALSQWIGLVIFIAGILQGALDKITPRQAGVPDAGPNPMPGQDRGKEGRPAAAPAPFPLPPSLLNPVPVAPAAPSTPRTAVMPAPSLQPSTVSPASDSADADARFARCVDLVLGHEGGLVNHPSDPGGITNYGISLRAARGMGSLADVDGDGDVDADDIVHMTRDEAVRIYRTLYWDAARCSDLPAGVDYIVFDIAVNSGPTRAVKMLQNAARAAQDGVIGPKTIKAVRDVANPGVIIDRIARSREMFYRSLKTFSTFGQGWLRRNAEVQAGAQKMVGR